MGNSNRDNNRSGGGRFFGGRRDFNNRGTDRPALHKAVCSKCKKECEVPFRPTGSKPVFCRDCFREMGGSDSRRNDRGTFPRPNFDRRNDNGVRTVESPQYKEQFEALNIKLDKILKILTPVIPKEAPVIQEQPAIVPEKKKRVSKKVLLTPEEQS